MIAKIISGGQPGAEIAALDAALKLGIPHGGWAYRQVREAGGAYPEQYNLKTIDVPSYHIRLEKNIIDADGTVILTNGRLIIGIKIIRDLTNKHKKPCLNVNLTDCSINHAVAAIRKWIINNEIETIYFTGSKPVGESMIYEETIRIIEDIYRVEREQHTLQGFKENDDSILS